MSFIAITNLTGKDNKMKMILTQKISRCLATRDVSCERINGDEREEG